MSIAKSVNLEKIKWRAHIVPKVFIIQKPARPTVCRVCPANIKFYRAIRRATNAPWVFLPQTPAVPIAVDVNKANTVQTQEPVFVLSVILANSPPWLENAWIALLDSIKKVEEKKSASNVHLGICMSMLKHPVVDAI